MGLVIVSCYVTSKCNCKITLTYRAQHRINFRPLLISLLQTTQVVICPLGAGQEVGRSCFLLGFQHKGVMFDCGIHPAHKGTFS